MSVRDSTSSVVETSLFRALAIFRATVLAFAVGINAVRWRDFEVVWLGWAVIAVMVVWTLLITWVYDSDPPRKGPWLVADLAVAIGCLATTPVVQTTAQLDASDPTIPTFWVSAALIAWALHWQWQGGLVAALTLSTVDLSIRNQIDSTAIGNIFLLFMAAGVIGYCVGLLHDAAAVRTQAERWAAAAEERDRIARDIHDGVLQVLALVQRRGHEIGGQAAELGRLAGEQEVALRRLVHRPVDSVPQSGETDLVDLGERIDTMAGSRVTVSTPAAPVWVADRVGGEIVSAVLAALDNTRLHAGDGARAWVLVEEDGEDVVLSVRDDGDGIAAGRLEEATAEGRMGVSKSILGRLDDLGGTADLTTAPGKGVEWELRFPRRG